MPGLYPPLLSYHHYRLDVGDGHTLYVEESGNPDGIPVVYLHGGPGGGCSSAHRRFFDPNRYRIILFDQRGAGRSEPHASLEENTIWKLVDDIEFIREHLGIENWVVSGGSWGSTLALVYAINHSHRVQALLLRGIFLGRNQDIDWLYREGGGAPQIFPDYHKDFMQPLGGTEKDPIAAYYTLLTCNNELLRLQAAKAWTLWEGRISSLRTPPDVERRYGDTHLALAMSRIECHYFFNHCFFEENYILDNVQALAGIPGVIIHGRYDIVCKLENATSLHQAWPDSELQIVPESGHSAGEPGISRAMCLASDRIATRLLQV